MSILRFLGRGWSLPVRPDPPTRSDAVRRLATDHFTGRVDHSRQLWALLALELWHREFLDRG